MQTDLAGFQHIAAVGNGERHAGVLLDQENAQPLAPDALDGVEDLLDQVGGEAERGLVEQQQFWARHQGAGDRQHLLLAAGQRACGLPIALAQPRKERKALVEIVAHGPLVGARKCAEPQILRHAHFQKKLAGFRHHGDPQPHHAVGPQSFERAALEPDAAAARQQAGDHPERRGLSGAVGPEQRDDRPGRDLKVDAVQHRDLAVGGVDVTKLEHACLPDRRAAPRDRPGRNRRTPPRSSARN